METRRMGKTKAIFNWSGGKDSSLCLYKVLRSGSYEVWRLLTTVNGAHRRISMHGVRVELLRRQAELLALPLIEVTMPSTPTMEAYDLLMAETLGELKKGGAEGCIYGDIFLEDLRRYREERLAEVGLEAIFPLWRQATGELAREFIELGFRAIVVCVNDRYLDRSFAGREIDDQFLDDLPLDVDPCGENGEFHSFVFDGPIFSEPLHVEIGEIVHRKYEPPGSDEGTSGDVCNVGGEQELYDTGFWYCDLLAAKGGAKGEIERAAARRGLP